MGPALLKRLVGVLCLFRAAGAATEEALRSAVAIEGNNVVIIAQEIILNASITLNVTVNVTSNNTCTLNGDNATSIFVVASTVRLSLLEFLSGRNQEPGGAVVSASCETVTCLAGCRCGWRADCRRVCLRRLGGTAGWRTLRCDRGSGTH